MLIDFFTYTDATSGGTLSAEALVEKAKQSGLDGICVTDREASANVDAIVRAGEAAGLFVGVGVEIATETGIVTIFPKEVDGFLRYEEWRELTTFGAPEAQEVVDLIAARGGIAVARSVYTASGDGLRDGIYRLDKLNGVDVLDPSRRRIDNELALEAMTGLNISGLGGSGALKSDKDVGRVATLVAGTIASQADLVEAVRAGNAWPAPLCDMDGAIPTGGGGGRSDHRSSDRRPDRDRDRRGPRGGGRDRRGGRDRDRRSSRDDRRPRRDDRGSRRPPRRDGRR